VSPLYGYRLFIFQTYKCTFGRLRTPASSVARHSPGAAQTWKFLCRPMFKIHERIEYAKVRSLTEEKMFSGMTKHMTGLTGENDGLRPTFLHSFLSLPTSK